MSNVTGNMSNMHGMLAKTGKNRHPIPDSGLQPVPLCSHSYTISQDSG